MEAIVERLFSNDLVKKELQHMPILLEMIEDYSNSKPLQGKNLAFSHVIAPNTIVMIATILAAGANLDIYINNGFYHDQRVINHLKDCGLPVYDDFPTTKLYDFSFDCAGYFLDYPTKVGVVEVTKTGILKYKENGLNPYIMIDVDSTKTKLLETFLGNPQGLVIAMRHFISDFDHYIEDKSIAIIGFGKIGRGSARIFREMGNDVTILDISATVIAEAKRLGFHSHLIGEDRELNSKYISTGHYGTITTYFDKSSLNQDMLKINLGVEDEWGDDYTEQELFHSKYKPFNFNMSPPTPSKYIDPILALQILGMVYLVEDHMNLDKDHHIIPKHLDNSIVDKFNQLHNHEGDAIDQYFEI